MKFEAAKFLFLSLVACLEFQEICGARGRKIRFSTKKRRICQSRPYPGWFLNQHLNHQYFYVDIVNGNDDWSGNFPEIKTNGKGPFKTLIGALRGIRKQRTFNSRKATLFVRQGVYFVNETITLNARDSGLSIMGFPEDRRPLISGGYIIPGKAFVPYDQHKYVARFQGECSRHAFLGRKRLVRARKPNQRRWKGNELTGEGPYLVIKDLLHPTPECDRLGSGGFKQSSSDNSILENNSAGQGDCHEDNKLGFIFENGDIDSQWWNIEKSEILVFGSWTAERGQIKNITENRVYFSRPLRHPIGKHPKPSGWRYIVENIFEELDAPGEFYCNEEEGLFFFIPPGGIQQGTTIRENIFIGATETIFKVRNAEDIRFSDLEFRHTRDRNYTAYNPRPGILDFKRTKGVSIDFCSFSNVGHTAIYLLSSINVKVLMNSFKDIGYIGICTDYKNRPYDSFATKDILIKKNTFEGCGVTSMLQPCCVHVKGAGKISVSDNEISRSSYAGIRVGWQRTFSSNYVPKGKYVFYIERNNIHDFGMGILNDFAGVYLSSNRKCGAADRDLKKCHLHAYVAKNTIHHSHSFFYGALGVYGDTAVASLTVEKNWLYHLGNTAINFNCGQNNFAINNMIYHTSYSRVFGTCNSNVGPGERPRQILTFKRNVIYVANIYSRMFGRTDAWEKDTPQVNSNIYFFNPFNREQFRVFFPKYSSWHTWRRRTNNDRNSTIANPYFWNVQRNDYRLKRKSVAFNLGIESVDLRFMRYWSGACYSLTRMGF